MQPHEPAARVPCTTLDDTGVSMDFAEFYRATSPRTLRYAQTSLGELPYSAAAGFAAAGPNVVSYSDGQLVVYRIG